MKSTSVTPQPAQNCLSTSLTRNARRFISAISSSVARPSASAWSSLSSGSPSSSFLYENSIVGRAKTMPSSTPYLFEKDPAEMFLIMTSSGTIDTLRTTVSRSDSSST